MTYRHNGILTDLKLSDCDVKCPLDDFVEKTKNRVPTNRVKDCHSTPEKTFFTYHSKLKNNYF